MAGIMSTYLLCVLVSFVLASPRPPPPRVTLYWSETGGRHQRRGAAGNNNNMNNNPNKSLRQQVIEWRGDISKYHDQCTEI